MMRKFLAILVAMLLLIPAAGTAETDLSAMSDEELVQLRDAANLELAARRPAEGPLAVWDTARAHIELLSIRRGVTDDGQQGVELVFSYTNTTEEVDNFRANHWVTVYQQGVECDRSIFLDGELVDTDSWSKKVQPGSTLNEMQWFFIIPADTDTIDVEIEDRAGYPTQSAGIFTVKLPD